MDYKVHEATTPEEQCSIPDLHILNNDEHRTITSEALKSPVRSRVITSCDYGKQRSTGCLQLDYHTVCASTIVPLEEHQAFKGWKGEHADQYQLH